MIKNELNSEQGKRLKSCIKEKQLTQTEFANITGYTKQYISNICVGKKNLSLESARTFSKILNVREEYLLCEDDIKTEKELEKMWHDKFDLSDNLALHLLELAGYTLICDFIENWKDLDLDNFSYTPHSPHDDITNHLPLHLLKKVKYTTEIMAPNGKIFYCDTQDLSLLGYELIEYIHFRMKQLESKYAWLFDEGQHTPRVPGSELSFYNSSKDKKVFLDLLADSGLWLDHDDDCFPGMEAYYDNSTNE